MAMFYRMDGSDYLFYDWTRWDACNNPDDKDARGRRCGQRARSYKGAKAGLDKMKKGPKYSGADIKATQKALERRKRKTGQDLTNTREGRRIGKLADQQGMESSGKTFYNRQKAGGGLGKGTYATSGSLGDYEDVTRMANKVSRR